jgi:hypothetical protein
MKVNSYRSFVVLKLAVNWKHNLSGTGGLFGQTKARYARKRMSYVHTNAKMPSDDSLYAGAIIEPKPLVQILEVPDSINLRIGGACPCLAAQLLCSQAYTPCNKRSHA